jgi:hypothetical protein
MILKVDSMINFGRVVRLTIPSDLIEVDLRYHSRAILRDEVGFILQYIDKTVV